MPNQFFIQDISLWELSKKYSTPFYVYDENVIRDHYRALHFYLPKNIEIFYSIKANPNLAVCAVLKNLGVGAEVCSRVELETALRVGFNPGKIVFAGPAKKTDDLSHALSANIHAIVCESLSEFERIAQLSAEGKKPASILLRINPDFGVKTASLKMGGTSSQFGMDAEWLLANKKAFTSPHVNIIGIHIYNATRILQSELFLENTQRIFAFAEKLSRAWSINFSTIDIGGGIGVPYFEGEKDFNLPALAHLKNLPAGRIILESGRYLTATSGIFVTQVVDVKHSRGENFLITDGGMNCHLSAAGYGSLIKKNFPISAVTASNKSEKYVYHISGPLCTPADIIGRNVLLPRVEIGDLILVHQSGAYGATASPGLFLSHGFPAEILITNGQDILIRESESLEDFFNKQKLFIYKELLCKPI